MFDIIVIGAGPTGLVSALTFAKAGYDVAVIDPVDRASVAASECSNTSRDRRTTAHLTPTVKFLEDLLIWNEISRNACALEKLVIIEESSQHLFSGRRKKTVFDPLEVGNRNFGYNVPIKDSLEALSKLVQANKNHSRCLSRWGELLLTKFEGATQELCPLELIQKLRDTQLID